MSRSSTANIVDRDCAIFDRPTLAGHAITRANASSPSLAFYLQSDWIGRNIANNSAG